MESVELGQAKLREIHEVMEQIALDSTKFFTKGNKAAGVRARKALQDLKQLAQDLRVAIQRCKSEGVHARAPDVHADGAVVAAAGAPLGHLDGDAAATMVAANGGSHNAGTLGVDVGLHPHNSNQQQQQQHHHQHHQQQQPQQHHHQHLAGAMDHVGVAQHAPPGLAPPQPSSYAPI